MEELVQELEASAAAAQQFEGDMVVVSAAGCGTSWRYRQHPLHAFLVDSEHACSCFFFWLMQQAGAAAYLLSSCSLMAGRKPQHMG
jgi:hypothetical protein